VFLCECVCVCGCPLVFTGLAKEVPVYPVGHVAKSFGPCFVGGLTSGIVRDTVQEQQ